MVVLATLALWCQVYTYMILDDPRFTIRYGGYTVRPTMEVEGRTLLQWQAVFCGAGDGRR